jgi:hypothetical protein
MTARPIPYNSSERFLRKINDQIFGTYAFRSFLPTLPPGKQCQKIKDDPNFSESEKWAKLSKKVTDGKRRLRI